MTLLNVPFRLHGRSVDAGLDCVGVLACCLSAAGQVIDVAAGYSLRGDFEARAHAFFDRDGFESVGNYSWVAGDILLLRPGSRQVHFAVLTCHGAVHAQLGLRRVVLTPLPLPYCLVGQWRFYGD
jgi:hypothetical protein